MCLRLPGNIMLKRPTPGLLMPASVNAKHTRLGSGGCYALVKTTTQIAMKMPMPTDRHQPKLNELDAVVMVLLVSCLQDHYNKDFGFG